MPSATPVVRRVGLREVAEAAGVCLMTVSLSLRDSPRISPETRARVRETAEKLGYRPDPEIARLMGQLRSSRMVRNSVAIALIDVRAGAAPPDHAYVVALRKGVLSRAEALGYGTAMFRLHDYGRDAERMLRVVRNRGITGVILLPGNEPISFPPSVKWDGLSVVAATTSVLFPRFHKVVPNQLFNAMTIVEDILRRGYKRIGAILSQSLEQRSGHQYSLALNWHGHGKHILLLPDAETPEQHAARIAQWMQRRDFDVVFAQDINLVRAAMRRCKPVPRRQLGLVSLSTIDDPSVAYQDELPGYIGESAVSLLAGMMHNNETGVPLHARSTVVDGVFHEGPTIRGARPRSGAARAER